MDDWHEWHRKLALELGAETPAGAVLDGAAHLEIAFGKARSVVTYALELALAHRVPATGCVTGDDIWLRLGEGRARFTLNRREGFVAVSESKTGDARVRWDDARSLMVQIGAADAGDVVDLDALARGAVDSIVADWRASVGTTGRLSAPPPDFDDEPTKG
jgi:hypothetical protein